MTFPLSSSPSPNPNPNPNLEDFAPVQAIFDAVAGCLRSEGDLRRLIREIVQDQAEAGCRHLELMVYPNAPLGEQWGVPGVATPEDSTPALTPLTPGLSAARISGG
jgi:hypothetical protein